MPHRRPARYCLPVYNNGETGSINFGVFVDSEWQSGFPYLIWLIIVYKAGLRDNPVDLAGASGRPCDWR